jgi:ATP synthase F1 delta subunit
MFVAQRWAQAFLGACGDKKTEGLAVLRVFESCAGRRNFGAGSGAARRLGSAFHEALDLSARNAGTEAACRTVMLLVKKGLVKHLSVLVCEAEKAWNAENGILVAVLDSAFPPSDEFTQTLVEAIKRKTAAREVRLNVRLEPRLIGGCRLHIGTQCLDASISGQLHKMAEDLHAVGGFSW